MDAGKKEWRSCEWKWSWAAIAVLSIAVVYAFISQQVFWIIMGLWALGIALYPVVLWRDVKHVLPFEVLLFISIPFLIFLSNLFVDPSKELWYGTALRLGEIMAIFLIGFMTMLSLQVYTTLRMDRRFAVLFTIILTTALSVFFAIGDVISGALFNITTIETNTELMLDLISSFLGGIGMGIILDLYLKHNRFERFERFALGCELEAVQ